MRAGLPLPRRIVGVALPLAEINDTSMDDEMLDIGSYPEGIYYQWARLADFLDPAENR